MSSGLNLSVQLSRELNTDVCYMPVSVFVQNVNLEMRKKSVFNIQKKCLKTQNVKLITIPQTNILVFDLFWIRFKIILKVDIFKI